MDHLATRAASAPIGQDAAKYDEPLMPCPFCGSSAEFERKGSARQSCIVVCTECGCRLETGEVFQCGLRWNTRFPPSLMKVNI